VAVYRVLAGEVFVDAETFTRKIAAEISTAKLRAVRQIKQVKTVSIGVQTDLKGLKNDLRVFLRNDKGEDIDPNKKFFAEKQEQTEPYEAPFNAEMLAELKKQNEISMINNEADRVAGGIEVEV